MSGNRAVTDPHGRARFQFLDAAYRGLIAGAPKKGEVFGDCARVKFSTTAHQAHQRFDFAGKNQPVTSLRIIKRLYPEMVAGEENLAGHCIVASKGEDAVNPLKKPLAICSEPLQKDLGVAMTTKFAATRCQLGLKVGKVIYFSVKGDRVAPVTTAHGLSARRGWIDDCQARVTEANQTARINEDTRAIGTAVGQR